MLTEQEVQTIDRVLASVVEGMEYVEAHPELSAMQAAAAGGAQMTALTSRFKITAADVEAIRARFMGADRALVDEKIAATEEDAKVLVDLYFEAFPTLRDFFFKAEDTVPVASTPVPPENKPDSAGKEK